MIDMSKSAMKWIMRPRSFFFIQLLLFVVIFALAFHVMYDHFMDTVKEAAKSNNTIANQIAGMTHDRHKSIINILQSYAARPLLIDAVKEKDPVAATMHLANLKKSDPEIDVAFIADRKSFIWVSLPFYKETIGKDLSHRDWYRGVSRQWKPYATGVFKSSTKAQNAVVALSVPVFDGKGRPVGILSVGQLTQNFGSAIRDFTENETTKITLIDQSGNIICTNQLPYEKKVMQYRFSFSGNTIGAYAPVKELMWTVVVEKEKGTILASLVPYFAKTAVAFFILYLLTGLALVFLRKQVVFKQAFALLAAEDMLQKSEERHRLVIEQTGQLIYDFDVQSDSVILSGAISQVIGYEPDEIPFDTNFWKAHLHPDDREPVVKFLMNVVRNRLSHYKINYRFQRKDGTYIQVEDNGMTLKDGKDRVYRVIATMKDVTYQWQAEQNQKFAIEILKVLNRSNNLINIISDILKLFKEYTGIEAMAMRLKEGEDFPYYVQNGFSDDFIEKERYLCARDEYGATIHDKEGNPHLECMCGNVLCGRIDPSLPFFTEGGSFWTNSAAKLLAATSDKDQQARMRNRCGFEGYESVALVPLRLNREIIGLLQLNDHRENLLTPGFIRYLEGIGSSIGVALRRLQTEDTLKESEEKYRSIFENIAEGIFQTVPGGRCFISVNPAMARIHGFSSPEEMVTGITNIGKQLYFNPEDRKRYREIFEKSGTVRNFEAQVYRKDGNTIWTSTSSYAVKNAAGKMLRFEGIVEDITERKQGEEALLIKTMLLEAQSETSIDGILAVDNEGRSLLFNKRFGELWRIPQNILDTKDDARMLEYIFKQLKDPEGFSSSVAYLYEHRDEKSRDEIEFADGRCFDRYSSPLVSTDGQHLGRIWFFRDITERKQGEEKLRTSLIGTIQVISLMLETRDPYTAGHQKRVSSLARSIAQEMNLSNDMIGNIRMAGTIHDIGKLSVPAEILSKPTKLTDVEFSLIKIHPQTGYDILKDVELPSPIAKIVLQHHERLDGSGYPQGLKGEDIILEARIIAVADVVEAIASHRPYRPARGIDAALEEIRKNQGVLYDSAAVDACIRVFKEKRFSFS